MRPPTDEERFWPEVYKTDSCWLWMGFKRREYGAFWLFNEQRWVPAHRFSYEGAHGSIPAGLHVDHLCRVPACVRPDHLEAVTHKENMRRKPKPTHCPNGHEYTPENISRSNIRDLICKTCARKRSLESQRKIHGRTHLFGKPATSPRDKTHCPHGHEYSIENTRIDPKTGKRSCKICGVDAMRRYRERHRLSLTRPRRVE